MKITIFPFLALLGLSQGNAASTTAYTWDAISGDLSTTSGAVFGNLSFTGNANPNLGFSDVEGQGRFFFAIDPNNVPRTISYELTFTDERSSLVSAMFGSGGITPTGTQNAVVGGNNGMASQFTIDAVDGTINDIGLSTLITGYQTSITTGSSLMELDQAIFFPSPIRLTIQHRVTRIIQTASLIPSEISTRSKTLTPLFSGLCQTLATSLLSTSP